MLTVSRNEIGIEWTRISFPTQKTLFCKLIKRRNRNKEYFLDIGNYYEVAPREQAPIEACFQPIERFFNEPQEI
jgi:hypothetical protein